MGNRLYVGNLSFNATTDSIREWFASCGTVTDVHVVMDRETGRSRGFAFVTMATDAEAQKAIAETNEAEERQSRGGGGGFGGGGFGGGGGGRGGRGGGGGGFGGGGGGGGRGGHRGW